MTTSLEGEPNPIDELQQRLGVEWAPIKTAREEARKKRKQLENDLMGYGSSDTSLVVFGSLARDEFTNGSDIDWTLLIDGSADPQHDEDITKIANYVNNVEERPPGRQGTFGGRADSHDIIHLIGGERDANRNITQRILLLLESKPLCRPEAYERVIRNVLRRYVREDYGLVYNLGKYNVPRFLQNDIARFWRTVAVDFAYKKSQRPDGWALRAAKLRISRKLTYVAGLLMCFRCEIDMPNGSPSGKARDLQPITELLWKFSQHQPLEILAETLLRYPVLDGVARQLFETYSHFLVLLNDKEKRDHLKNLSSDEVAPDDPVYDEVRVMGHRFQDSLTRIFLEENGTPLYKLTREYGVF
jgi:predicted nucleotidyltransferase